MNAENFFDDLDLLIKSGENTIPEHDIDISAFHLISSIKSGVKKWKFGLIVSTMLFLLMVGLALVFFLFPAFQNKLGFIPESELKKKESENQVQVDRLASENGRLKNIIDSLENQVAISMTASSVDWEQKDIIPGDNEGEDGIIRHLVEKGETLYSLALKYYGRGPLYEILADDNNLHEPTDLAEGMTLKIYPDKKQH